jgi:hypothetical protein
MAVAVAGGTRWDGTRALFPKCPDVLLSSLSLNRERVRVRVSRL